jgi:hypothetical protein
MANARNRRDRRPGSAMGTGISQYLRYTLAVSNRGLRLWSSPGKAMSELVSMSQILRGDGLGGSGPSERHQGFLTNVRMRWRCLSPRLRESERIARKSCQKAWRGRGVLTG